MAKINGKNCGKKNAERERSRVRSLRNAFQTLQSCLPSVPPDTKLSKLDILILATNYIAILMETLGNKDIELDIIQPTTATAEMMTMPNFESSSTSIMKSNHLNQTKVYRPIKKWPMRSRLYSMIKYCEHLDNRSQCSDVNVNYNHNMPTSNQII